MSVAEKRAFYANADQKPSPPPPDPAGIPEELRAAPRWVPWHFELTSGKDGVKKWTKVPLSAKTGRRADCNAPRSWGTLRQCLNMVEAGTADGVGFAFTGSGYVGVDLDGHRDPATGELSAFAQLVLLTFCTYCEVSPSSTGLKLVGKGALPADTPKDVAALGIEVFDRGFFCLTGRAVPGTPPSVADLQPAIDAHLADILTSDRARPGNQEGCDAHDGAPLRTSKNLKTARVDHEKGAALARSGSCSVAPSVEDVEARVRLNPDGAALMSGDTRAHHDDHSGADLALCNLIAFYAGSNPDLIDAVFRRSGLMRDKWDERHARDGRSYGEMTVSRALADKCEFFDWSPRPTITFGSGGTAAAPAAGEQELPWPEMPAAAHHGPAGEFVRLIEPNTEADPVALLVQFLAMFGSAAGRGAFLRVERTRHHANEFVVLVGRSAKGRKGTSEAWPSDLMQTAAPDWSKNCRTGKLASGEALVWMLRDPVFGTVDGERQCTDEGVEDKRLLITEGEFSAILKVASKEQNTLSDQLRDAWDGKDLNNKSKGSPCKATEPHVAILAHTNDSDLKLLLTENAMANGFGNRFLLFAVRRSKSLPFGGKVDEAAFAELAGRVSDLIERAHAAGEMTWGADAAARWDAGGEYERLSRERYGLAGSLTGRAEAHVVRVAMLYALLDGARAIGLAHLEAALAVWGYAEATAYRLFGGFTGDPLADDLLRVIRRAPDGVGRWQLHQEAGKNIPAARIGAALATLQERDLARCDKRKTGGRAEEVWIAVAKEAKGSGP